MGTIAMSSAKTAWIGRLEWSCSGSSVTVAMYTGKTDGYPSSSASGANFTAAITVGSTTRSFSYQQQELDMYVGSVTVPVSGSTVNISGRVEAPYGVSMYGYPLTGSETVTLKTEPEVSPSEITLSADSVQMGEKLLISIDRDSYVCNHQLVCFFSDREYVMIAEDVPGSYAWTVPDLVQLCPNVVERTGYIACITYADGEYIGYTTAELTIRVPDATIPSLEGEALILGQENTLLCPRNSEHFTQKLTLEFYGLTLEIGEGKLDSLRWTPGYEPAGRIPNLTYGTGTLKCTTCNGTAQVGVETATVRVVVPENDETRPRLTGLILTPVSGLPEDFAGVYLRGKTGLRAEFTAESDWSELAGYAVTVGSQQAEGNPAVIDLLVSEGSVKVTGTVTDARGFSASVSAVIQVMPYRNPRITPCTGYSEVICERAKDTGELSPAGTFLAVKAGKTFSSVMLQGRETNSCELRYRWKPNGTATFCDWITLLVADSAENEISLLVGNVVTSLQRSYLVQIEASDTLGGSHLLTFQIMTEAVSFVLYDGEDGAGFGKYPEEAHVVDIASHMTLRVRGKLVVEGAVWTDLGLAEGVAESAPGCGRQPESGCHYLIWGGSHIYLAFDCGFGQTAGTVVINRDPIPEAYRPRRRAYALCPANDRGIVLVSADTDGFLRAQWVQQPADSAAIVWLDGYLDYWV